jgi:hypothetical protein
LGGGSVPPELTDDSLTVVATEAVAATDLGGSYKNLGM